MSTVTTATAVKAGNRAVRLWWLESGNYDSHILRTRRNSGLICLEPSEPGSHSSSAAACFILQTEQVAGLHIWPSGGGLFFLLVLGPQNRPRNELGKKRASLLVAWLIRFLSRLVSEMACLRRSMQRKKLLIAWQTCPASHRRVSARSNNSL